MTHEHPGHQKARCPECLAPIWVKDEVALWDPITCPECHTGLEIANLHPLELDYIASEWDEGEFEDDNW